MGGELMEWRDMWLLDPSGDLVAAYAAADPQMLDHLRGAARAVYDQGTVCQMNGPEVRIAMVPMYSEFFSGIALVLWEPGFRDLERAGLAHDINNLLAVAQGQVELAGRSAAEDGPLSEALWTLNLAGALVRRLAGYPAGETADVAVRDALRHLTHHLDTSGYPVQWALADNLPLVAVDVAGFVEIFQNILKNAAEALPSTGPIRISAQARDRRVFITIADAGPGMTEDEVAHAFDAYTSYKTGGHGLGLYRTRQLVEQYQGDIAIESTPGSGTTVRVALPAKAADGEELP